MNIRPLIAALSVAALFFAPRPAAAQDTPSPAATSARPAQAGEPVVPTGGAPYAIYYGDGLRYYAEGQYVNAVENLFRAYALRPEAGVMRLIVRSYDAMGHCDAARRQKRFFDDTYPRERAPNLEQCKSPAQLTIACAPYGTPVTVNRFIDTHCGAEVAVPAGTHHVESPAHMAVRTVTIDSGERGVAEIANDPQRWPEATSASHRGVVHVPRLNDPAMSYAVFQSPDGLYRIWVRTERQGDSPLDHGDDYPASPRVEIVCTDDAADADRGCLLLQEIQRRPRQNADAPARYRSFVPTVH